ncbi:MAG: hypothetical protein Wins2KO_29090 [Winogradskyella sp.]
MKMIRPLLIAFILLSFNSNAQDVKNQSEIIRNNVSKGDYKIVADLYNSHRGVANISDIKFDKNQPNMHFEVTIKKYPNHARESDRNAIHQYFPDHIAFPVTYISSAYEGNKKLQEKVGYVVREGRSVGDDRIVFIDNYLFMLQNWKSKDDYEIRWILMAPKAENGDNTEENVKPKKKKKGFFKSLKDKVKKAKSGAGSVSIEKMKAEVLQPYLDKATKKQQDFYQTWIKKSENKKTKKYLDDKRALMTKAIKQYNDDIFNSPEYQRMLAYQKWIDNNINVTVYNKSDRTVWVGSSSSAFITSKIEAGGSSTQTCTSDLYYYYSDTKGSKGYKFYTANSACGSTATIN